MASSSTGIKTMVGIFSLAEKEGSGEVEHTLLKQ